MKIGYCAKPKDIELIKELGYDYIELPLATLAEMSDEEFDAVVKDLEVNKLPCQACNLFLPKSQKITGANRNHPAALAYAELALSRAEKVGAKYVVLGSSGSRNIPADYSPAEALGEFVEFCKACGPIAQRYGVTVVIEPLNSMESNMINTVAEGHNLVLRTAHPNIKVLADYYHMLIEKEPLSSIAEAGGDLQHTHTANLLGRVIPQAADEAVQKKFVDALKGIGYSGGLSIEGKFVENQKIEAANSLTLMRKLIK